MYHSGLALGASPSFVLVEAGDERGGVDAVKDFRYLSAAGVCSRIRALGARS